MADITAIATLKYFQWNRPSAENPRLAAPIASDATTITVTNPPLDEDGKIVEAAFLMGIKNLSTGYVETVYVPTQAVQGYGNTPDSTNLGLTITGATRGIDLSGLDLTTGGSTLRTSHGQDSPVFCNVSGTLQAMNIAAIQGAIFTGAELLKVGNDADNDIYYYASNGDANEPYLKYDSASNAWVYANDGASENPMAGSGALNAGDGIDISGGTVAVDLTATPGLEFSSSDLQVKADASRGISLDSNGVGLDIATNPGLEFSSNELRAKVKASGGITRDGDGLSVNESDLSLRGRLISSTRLYQVGDANNAGENGDTTVTITAPDNAGLIVIDYMAQCYGNTANLEYTGEIVYSTTSFVSQTAMSSTLGSSILNNSSAITLVGNGANRRNVSVTVTAAGGAGTDVTVRCAFTVDGSPGTNPSYVEGSIKVYQAN